MYQNTVIEKLTFNTLNYIMTLEKASFVETLNVICTKTILQNPHVNVLQNIPVLGLLRKTLEPNFLNKSFMPNTIIYLNFK